MDKRTLDQLDAALLMLAVESSLTTQKIREREYDLAWRVKLQQDNPHLPPDPTIDKLQGQVLALRMIKAAYADIKAELKHRYTEE